jgi:sec-independent protein translocase protein TatA
VKAIAVMPIIVRTATRRFNSLLLRWSYGNSDRGEGEEEGWYNQDRVTPARERFRAEGVLAVGSLGLPELLVILFIVILIFGSNKLPQLGRGVGSAIKNFKEGMNDQTPPKS